MSAECERTFSSAALTLTQRRSNMNDDSGNRKPVSVFEQLGLFRRGTSGLGYLRHCRVSLRMYLYQSAYHHPVLREVRKVSYHLFSCALDHLLHPYQPPQHPKTGLQHVKLRPQFARPRSPSSTPHPHSNPNLPDQAQQLQKLESTVNSKFAELQALLQQHDKSAKQILKAHENSVKQSIKAQLEQSHAEQRRYVDDALSNPRGGGVLGTKSGSRERID